MFASTKAASTKKKKKQKVNGLISPLCWVKVLHCIISKSKGIIILFTSGRKIGSTGGKEGKKNCSAVWFFYIWYTCKSCRLPYKAKTNAHMFIRRPLLFVTTEHVTLTTKLGCIKCHNWQNNHSFDQNQAGRKMCFLWCNKSRSLQWGNFWLLARRTSFRPCPLLALQSTFQNKIIIPDFKVSKSLDLSCCCLVY